MGIQLRYWSPPGEEGQNAMKKSLLSNSKTYVLDLCSHLRKFAAILDAGHGKPSHACSWIPGRNIRKFYTGDVEMMQFYAPNGCNFAPAVLGEEMADENGGEKSRELVRRPSNTKFNWERALSHFPASVAEKFIPISFPFCLPLSSCLPVKNPIIGRSRSGICTLAYRT